MGGAAHPSPTQLLSSLSPPCPITALSGSVEMTHLKLKERLSECIFVYSADPTPTCHTEQSQAYSASHWSPAQ